MCRPPGSGSWDPEATMCRPPGPGRAGRSTGPDRATSCQLSQDFRLGFRAHQSHRAALEQREVLDQLLQQGFVVVRVADEDVESVSRHSPSVTRLPAERVNPGKLRCTIVRGGLLRQPAACQAPQGPRRIARGWRCGALRREQAPGQPGRGSPSPARAAALPSRLAQQGPQNKNATGASANRHRDGFAKTGCNRSSMSRKIPGRSDVNN